MPTIKSNERELSAKVTQWLDDAIKSASLPFKEASAEAGVTADARTYFADTIIWYDRQTNRAASYIELKAPFGKKENLDRFRKKASALKVKYAFTWDFQTLKWYEVKEGQVSKIREEQIPVLGKIEEWKRADKQAIIKTVIGKICGELASLLETGKPRAFIPDKVFFVDLIRKTTGQLLDVFESFIQQAQFKPDFKRELSRYARLQGIPQTEDHVKILTNHVVYGFITKIIFYLTIRRYFTDLPALDEADGIDLSTRIRKAFGKARDRDWQAVFEEDPIEQLGIPKEAHSILFEFFSELRAYHFGELPEDVIGQLFEEIIEPEKRHRLGQYFTREDLVDLVLAAVVRDLEGTYCDPTCGSGTFLVRLYDRLKFLSANNKSHKEMLDQIWGFDIGKFPAELSTVNLFRQNVREYDNFPRVRKTDIFDVVKGKTFDFPPPRSGSKAIKVHLTLPEFNALVGNFPYIRQELIEKEVKGYKRKLTRVLALELLQSYPKLFELKGITLDELTKPAQIERALGKDWLDLRLSGQADIFAYIYLHTATLLKGDGSFAIITSNSWLDVGYGAVLKQFFVDHFRVKMIIATWEEAWFEDVAVNTVITVMEKEQDEEKRDNNSIHFVKLKKKLADLIPYDLKLGSNKRWQKLNSIVAAIEESENNKDCATIGQNISSLETDEMRVRIVPQRVLRDELGKEGELAKWGKYLRAPNVYFEILEKLQGKIVPLKEIANVVRGYTTGINEFFYLEKTDKPKNGSVKCRNSRGWEGEIEEQYLQEIIKSPKEAEGILIDKNNLRYVIFACNKSKGSLKKANHVGALNYIEWGERQKTDQGKAWPEVPSVRSREYWWGITEEPIPELIYPCGINDSFRVYENTVKVLNDKRLYRVYTKGKEMPKYLLNSSLTALFTECNSRISLGDGLLDLTVYEVEETPVPNPSMFSDKDKRDINKAYQSISKRKIEDIHKETKRKDRTRLDTLILEKLGLAPDEYLPRIYQGLRDIVRERLELPKMRKKQQKEVVKLAVDQIKKAVIEECLPNGPKRFPDEFYEHPLAEKDLARFTTSGELLSYQHFFGQYDLIDTRNQKVFTVDSEIKAQFAVVLAKQNLYELMIPKDEKIAKKVLIKYRRYLKELEQKLIKSAGHQAHDWAVAERIAKEIMAEYGLLE